MSHVHLKARLGLRSGPGSGPGLQMRMFPWGTYDLVWWRRWKQVIITQCVSSVGTSEKWVSGNASRGNLRQALARSPAGRKGVLGRQHSECKDKETEKLVSYSGTCSCCGVSVRVAESVEACLAGKVGEREHQCLFKIILKLQLTYTVSMCLLLYILSYTTSVQLYFRCFSTSVGL